MMKKKLTLLILFAWAIAGGSWAQEVATSSGTPFFVELQNGERVYARKLQYKSPIFKQNFFLLDDSLKYAPESIKFFQNQEGFFARLNAGRRYSDFAQREMTGRVSTYFVLRTDYNSMSPSIGVGMGRYGYGGYGYGGYPTQRKVYYFSKDNAELVQMNYRNLRDALADNPGSLESLKQYKRSQNIQTAMYVVGAGLIFAGLQQSSGSNSGYSPLLFIGLGVTILPTLIKFGRKDRLTEAIEVYNYEPAN
jgi:hypothetical protein